MSASNLEGKAYLIKYAMYACQILYLCRAIVAFAWKACYFAREMYGDASYLYYFAQSALRNIEQTTDDCDLNNGGRHERNSTRLGFTYYADHRGCVGRYEGFYYGNEASLVIFVIAISIYLLSRYYSNLYSCLQALFAHLAELFVVTKPVELSQGVLVDRVSYNNFIQRNEQMERTILDYEAKMPALEHIAQWCKSHHANPEANIMKSQQNRLATAQKQLERLRLEYHDIQNRCQTLEDGKEDVQNCDTAKLLKAINTKDSEIHGLRATINALGPNTEKLEALRERTRELQKKLDAHIQESTAETIKAALEKETMAKLETSNKSLRLGTKAAEERAQAVATSHKKAMEEAQKRIRALEEDAACAAFEMDQVENYKKAIEEAEKKLGDLEAAVAGADFQMDQAMKYKRGMKRAQKKIKALEASVVGAKLEMDQTAEYKKAIEEAEKKIQDLEVFAASAKLQLDEAAEYKKASEEAQKKIEALEVIAADAELQLDKATSHKKASEEARKKIEALEIVAAGAVSQMDQARNEISAAKAENEKMRKELEAAKAAQGERNAQQVEAMKAELEATKAAERAQNAQHVEAMKAELEATKSAERAQNAQHVETMKVELEAAKEAEKEQVAKQVEAMKIELKAAKAADREQVALQVEAMRAELEAAKAADREQVALQVEAMKAELKAAKAAERAKNAQQIEAMKTELETTKSTHAEQLAQEGQAIKAQFEQYYEQMFQAAHRRLAEAAEAEITSRVEVAIAARVTEAIAERAAAEEAFNIQFGESGEFGGIDDFDENDEFSQIAQECNKRQDAREAAAAAVNMSTNLAAAAEPTPATTPTTSFGGPVDYTFGGAATTELAAAATSISFAAPAPSLFSGGPSGPAAATGQKRPGPSSPDATPRKRPVGKRTLPGLGNLPQHVVAHGRAQDAAAAAAAFDANKFFEPELPDINKPFEGERKRDEEYDPNEPYAGFNLR